MQSIIHAAHGAGICPATSASELARAEAFSRRTTTGEAAASGEAPGGRARADRTVVRHNRTAVSSAVLAVAGIGAGEPIRGAVLALVGESACPAQAHGAISPERGGQIARHVGRAQNAHVRGSHAASCALELGSP